MKFFKFIATIVCCALFALAPIPCSDAAANADESVSVTYYYGDTAIWFGNVPSGTVISVPSVGSFSDMCRENGLTVETAGKTLLWRINSPDGEPYRDAALTDDISLYAYLADEEQTAVFRYVYDYAGENDYKEITVSQKTGDAVSAPECADGKTIKGFFADRYLTVKKEIPQVAETNETFYLLLDGNVTFSVNGKSYLCAYGASVADVVNTESYVVSNAYLDENKTEKFDSVLCGGLTLYADFVRIAYAVTLIKDDETETVYVPVSDGVLLYSDFELYAKNWYLDKTRKNAADFPFALSEDTTLYGYDDEKSDLGYNEIIALSVVGGILVLAALAAAGARVARARRKKKLSAENTSKPVTGAETPKRIDK